MTEVEQIWDELNILKRDAAIFSEHLVGLSQEDLHRNDLINNLGEQIVYLKSEIEDEHALRVLAEDEVRMLLQNPFYSDNMLDNKGIRMSGCGVDETLALLNPTIPVNNVTSRDFEQSQIGLECRGAVGSNDQLVRRMSELNKRHQAACRMINESFQKVAAAIELTQRMTDERDRALTETARSVDEAKSLREVIDKLVNEAGERTKREVDAVRDQANQHMSDLLEQLSNTKKECSELALTLERSKSLSCLVGTNATATQHIDLRFEEALQRAHRAERDLEEMKLRQEACQLAYDRTLASKDSEIQCLNIQYQTACQRIRQLEEDQAGCEARVHRTVGQLEATERLLTQTKHQSGEAQQTAVHKMLLSCQAAELRESETRLRLESLERVNLDNTKRWQELLNKQRKLTLRWRAEAEQLSEHAEAQAAVLLNETEAYKLKCDRLTALLTKLDGKDLGNNSHVDT